MNCQEIRGCCKFPYVIHLLCSTRLGVILWMSARHRSPYPIPTRFSCLEDRHIVYSYPLAHFTFNLLYNIIISLVYLKGSILTVRIASPRNLGSFLVFLLTVKELLFDIISYPTLLSSHSYQK